MSLTLEAKKLLKDPKVRAALKVEVERFSLSYAGESRKLIPEHVKHELLGVYFLKHKRKESYKESKAIQAGDPDRCRKLLSERRKKAEDEAKTQIKGFIHAKYGVRGFSSYRTEIAFGAPAFDRQFHRNIKLSFPRDWIERVHANGLSFVSGTVIMDTRPAERKDLDPKTTRGIDNIWFVTALKHKTGSQLYIQGGYIVDFGGGRGYGRTLNMAKEAAVEDCRKILDKQS